MKTRPAAEDTPCVAYANVYQHPLLDGSKAVTTGAQRREHTMLLNQATRLCGSCPMLKTCLTEAVTQFDVAGFTAGTTETQREQIRAVLDITPQTENLDAYAGTQPVGPIDTDEVYRLRMTNPTASLRSLAERLGCSVSTVKRHLRRVRAGADDRSDRDVTPDDVWAAREVVLGGHADVA